MSHYLICGYGGVGRALIDALKRKGHVVTCITRGQLQNMDFISHKIDLTKASSVLFMKEIFNDIKFDVVINTIGILHDDQQLPEKNIQQVNQDWLFRNVTINVLPSIYLTQALEHGMKRDEVLKFVTMSARVSSMSDNILGGWYSYRMSKAMLNMYLKNLSIEWKRKFPRVIVTGYHPGTVNTNLSEPFQKNIPLERLFDPKKAAKYFLDFIESMKEEDSGFLFDWKKQKIEF